MSKCTVCLSSDNTSAQAALVPRYSLERQVEGLGGDIMPSGMGA